MTDEEKRIQDEAIAYAKANRTAIARRITDPDIYLSEAEPVTVFMAGSPGAGKTEASIELLDMLEPNGPKILRIDPDELRAEFPGYTGGNAWLFQKGMSLLVERILDRAYKNRQTFLLDGTLASHDVAAKNIQRALDHGRAVLIIYVYQEPRHAWGFVQAREEQEGRRIEPETFIEQYFAARDVVNRLKAEFGRRVKVDLLLKNIDGGHKTYFANVERVDTHIPEKYDRASLRALLGLPDEA